MKYQDAHALKDASGKALVEHPVSCVDCHDPKTLNLRVSRPGFIVGIKAFKEHQGVKDYDPNRDASRQEMRSYVCGQCHVEYYFRGEKKTVTYPWKNGLRVEEIESYYDDGSNFPDGKPFKDWVHPESGAPVQVVFPAGDGRFAFGGLRPGRYRVVAQPAGETSRARWVTDPARMIEMQIPAGAPTEMELPAPKRSGQ